MTRPQVKHEFSEQFHELRYRSVCRAYNELLQDYEQRIVWLQDALRKETEENEALRMQLKSGQPETEAL